jgi:hypothetical protein
MSFDKFVFKSVPNVNLGGGTVRTLHGQLDGNTFSNQVGRP